MSGEWYQKLIDDHPKLFRELSYIECESGWNQLLTDLCDKLERLIKNDVLDKDYQYPPYAEQIKEKYGQLRIYIRNPTFEMSELEREAEILSSKTCENCGVAGCFRYYKNYWVYTRCDKCWEDLNVRG